MTYPRLARNEFVRTTRQLFVVDSTPGKGSRFTVLIPMSLESGLGQET